MKTPAGLIALLFLSAGQLLAGTGSLEPVDLRCEYLMDPLGIDTPRPRLSWVLKPESDRARGLSQQAYRVLAASRPDRLKPGRADLWDSGRVVSDQSIHVSYAGQTLASQQECFWQVQVWDQQGKESRWSAPGRWSMGLLQPSDWTGKWVGKDEPEPKSALQGTSWIWFPEGDPATAAPVGTRWFRGVVTVPAGRSLETAEWLLAGDNEFTAFANGVKVGSGANFKTASAVELKSALKPGRNVLAVSVKNVGDSPNPAGMVGLLTLRFAAGDPLVVVTDETWRASDRETAGWERPDFDDAMWVPARKLGLVGMGPWGEVGGPEDRRLPARQLRKEFQVERKVRRATAYLAGLGLSELYLNGRKVGDAVLSPALSDYTRRVFYVTYDVTAQLKRGANAVGVWLGNGRYFAPRVQVPITTVSYGFPKLLFQLQVEYEDGGSQRVVSDGSWRLTTAGPIRANNEYDGEEYDARREWSGWAEAGFDDAAWEPAQSVAAPGGALVAPMIPPIRVIETLRPKSLREVQPGVWIFDLGQNLVGWCRLRVKGPRGTGVRLRHAEILKPDGTLYLDNIRSAKVTDTYLLKGRSTEVYEPRFSYHGFRFVELTGFPGRPDLDTIEGCVVHDDLESAGDWTCSNPLLNRIYQNVRWGVRGNYRSISTDCPQRDERQGWLGDRSAESKGETFLFRTAALYAKWVQDMADAQKDNGSVPDVCPAYWPIYSDNVTWPSSTVIIPGHLEEQFGDTAVITRHYPSMQRWIDHMAGFLQDDLMPRDTYGDWCVPPEDPKLIHSQDPARKTNPTLLGTSYFIHCLDLMSRYATRLGRADDARRYGELAAKMKGAFNRKFLTANGDQYDNGSQTSCVLPLAFDLVPPENRDRIFAHLADQITRGSRNHVGTGLIGGQWLMRTLSDHGRADLAYTLASQKTYPSWGYMIGQGATTIWELWNGDTADPAMNSGNHVMLVGDMVIWFYEGLAGIQADPAQPGFKQIIMRPHPVGDLRFVKASHRSPYGLIRSEWEIGSGGFDWRITVPPNTRATVFVPSGGTGVISEGGRPIRESSGVDYLRAEGGYAAYSVASGRYEFTSR
jgi:alpha-L-rhamnosidase